MNMREIQVISEIVNYHSFLEAANNLSYPPSVISKYVSRVEEELGIKIFVRGSKSNKLTLTPEGQVLIHDIHRLYIGYQHMMELSKQLKGTFRNILRIGSQPRLGNLVEAEIISSFLLDNPDVDMEQVKMTSIRDLLNLLKVGKLDAMFASVPKNSKIEDYFRDPNDYLDIEITFLKLEKEMYLGISDKYLPGINEEAKFENFKDFSFAFSSPLSANNNLNLKEIESFKLLAKQSGFNIKIAYFGVHDTAVLKLATKMQIAVPTTNIPGQFEGIKFVRISDWNSYANIYFLCLKNNGKKMIQKLKKSIGNYLDQTASKSEEPVR